MGVGGVGGRDSLSLVGNSGRLTWVSHNSRKGSATHSYQCVQYFHVSKQWYGCQSVGFLTCAHMLMHAICTRELYGLGYREKLALEEKSLATQGTRIRVSIAPGFSVGRSTK